MVTGSSSSPQVLHPVVSLRTIGCVVAALMFLGGVATAQFRLPGDAVVDREIERLLVEGSDDESDEEFEDLLWLREHPLDLRRSASDELARLPAIDMQAALAIIDVVRHLQPRDLRELAASLSLSARQLLSLRAFTTLGSDSVERNLRGTARVRLERDLLARRGFREHLRRIVGHVASDSLDTIDVGTVYRGGRDALLMQLALTQGPLSIAATIASDRGEPLIHRDTLGYHYSSLESVRDTDAHATRARLAAHAGLSLAWQQRSLLAVLGDFTAELGQGLALGDARRRFARAGGASAPYVAARRLAPYRSSDENSFLRGVAAEVIVERPLPFRLRLLGFTSWRWLDASLDTIDGLDGRTPVIGSIRRDGYRRTTSELRRSGNALERTAALSIAMEHERWAVGVSTIRSDRAAAGGPTGAPTVVWSLDGRWSTRDLTLYGECAWATRPMLVGGLLVRHGGIGATLAGRIVPVGAKSPHGRTFPRSSSLSPERGVFAGIESRIAKELGIALGVDLAHRAIPTATIPFPHSTIDATARIDWTPLSGLGVEGRFERGRTPESAPVVDEIGREHRGILDVEHTRLGLVVRHDIDAAVTLRARLSWRSVELGDGTTSRGMMTSLDVRAAPIRTVDLRAGVTIFDTGDADAAVYAVESDLPGRVRSVQLSGVGRRAFLSLRWSLGSIGVAASVAETAYSDRRTIGSGLEAIDGASAPSAALQLDCRFGARGD